MRRFCLAKSAQTVSSAHHPLLCTGTAALGRQHESDYRAGRRGGAGSENTGTFLSNPDISSDPVPRATPHTASQQRGCHHAEELQAPQLLPPAQTEQREEPHARAKRETVFHQLIPPECNGVCSKEGLDLRRENRESKWLGQGSTGPPPAAACGSSRLVQHWRDQFRTFLNWSYHTMLWHLTPAAAPTPTSLSEKSKLIGRKNYPQ